MSEYYGGASYGYHTYRHVLNSYTSKSVLAKTKRTGNCDYYVLFIAYAPVDHVYLLCSQKIILYN